MRITNIPILLKYVIFTWFLQQTLCFAANTRNFETTRLKSTGGAGVGSFLVDEATFLNPAPLAFFNYSSVYVQKSQVTLQKEQKSGPSSNLLSEQKGGAHGFILSDAKGTLKGSLSYIKQDDVDNSKERWGASMAAPIAKSSAIGLQASRSVDTHQKDPLTKDKERYYQFALGATHAIYPEFSVGLVVIDPFKTRPEDTKLIIGFQYMIKEILTLIADGGADYNQDLSKTLLYRMALQLKLFSDLYLRAGNFYDKVKNEKGNGIGIGWVTPKLTFEVAVKSAHTIYDITDQGIENKLREYSLSLSYRF